MNKMKQKHKGHELTYAIDKNTNPYRLVHVDDVVSGKKCECICPDCKEPLVAKKGKIREHHFAHNSEIECEHAYETMLHMLAKEKICKAFYEQDEFIINFEYTSYCSKLEKCKYVTYEDYNQEDYNQASYHKKKCHEKTRRSYDLKKYYDSCVQEAPYDNIRRRSDLKFFSSLRPERDPIYIEFCVTHPSETKKLHSDNRIIECLIENEKDINYIVSNGFIEHSIKSATYRDTPTYKIEFHNFKSEDRNSDKINKKIYFQKYITFASRQPIYGMQFCKCQDFKRSRMDSIHEIYIHADEVRFDSFPYLYAKFIEFKEFHIPNCTLCINYINNDKRQGKTCRLYHCLQISPYSELDISNAQKCREFNLKQDEIDKYLDLERYFPYDVY